MLHSSATGVRTPLQCDTECDSRSERAACAAVPFYSDIFVIVVTSGMNWKLILQQDNKPIHMFRVIMNFPWQTYGPRSSQHHLTSDCVRRQRQKTQRKLKSTLQPWRVFLGEALQFQRQREVMISTGVVQIFHILFSLCEANNIFGTAFWWV